MYPILLNLGFFKLKSLTVLAILALFFSGFMFWRKGKEEHYDLMDLFDAFIVSGIFGVVVGRLAFVLFNWTSFQQDFGAIINIIKVPGNEPLLALAGAAFYLSRLAKKHKWDAYELLDFWVTAVSLGMVFVYLGFFLAGTYAGQLTNLPWGIVMPGTFEKSHPVQLYFVAFFLFLFNYLRRVEYRYRTFEWYRFGKKTAQSGFLLSMFLIFSAAFYLLMTLVSLPSMMFQGRVIDAYVYLLALVFGLVMLFKRSGRSLKIAKRKTERWSNNDHSI